MIEMRSRAEPLHSPVQTHGTEQAVLTASSGSSTQQTGCPAERGFYFSLGPYQESEKRRKNKQKNTKKET